MIKQIIGFANTMYTLWTVEFKKKNYGDTDYDIEEYIYQKNISKDIDKVKELYPSIEIDTTLRGHRSFEKILNKKQSENDVFWYGRYAGHKIDELPFNDYIIWYWDTKEYDSNKDYAKKVLESRKYHLINEREWLTDTEYNEYMSRNHRREELIQNFNENGFIDTTIIGNPNYYGELSIENNLIIIKFESVKQMYYNGYEYYIPIVNGKTKRLKNKRVRVYGNLEDDMINVTKIEILK